MTRAWTVSFNWGPRADRRYAKIAISTALLLHALLLWLVLRYVIVIVPVPRFISVILIQPAAHGSTAKRASSKQPAAASGLHFTASGSSSDLGINLAPTAGGTGNGRGGLEAFDDAVKRRIEAAKNYPVGLPDMWMECVIEYQVTVDRSGQLLSYKIYPCGNALLDSAARAAILTASPYPVPPNFGGTQYTVFGSLVYAQQ
jgi:outer membrane biosynthesis protein TonB